MKTDKTNSEKSEHQSKMGNKKEEKKDDEKKEEE